MGDHIRLCRLWAVFFVAFGMGACGGGNEPDTTPPRIVSANPADKAVKVSVTTDIKIVFSEPLDPATVTTSTFSIAGVVGARVTIDDRTHTVTIRPSESLSFGVTYQITCAGVKDKAGNEMQKTTLTFSTYKMSEAKSVFYRDGLVSNYWMATYDIDGRLIRWADNRTPGPDGVWFTSDDVAGRHYYNTWDGRGNLTREVDYSNNGPDGISWTADDGVDGYQVRHFDENNNLSERLSYFDPGPDNLWFTPDDKKGSDYKVFYDTNGKLIRAVDGSVGSDGVYADMWHASYGYDAWGNRTRETFHTQAGADSAWFTDDDEVLSYKAYVYDANGNIIREINSTGSRGLDGKLFTPDDEVFDHTSFIFDAKNNKIKQIYYRAGIDGVAQISDDTITGYVSYIYDSGGKLTRVTRYSGPGDDSVWFTADDGISSYTVNSYDDYGNKIRGIDFNGAGKDGIWVTADDTAYEYTAKTFDAHGNQLRAVGYYDAGADGLWLTQDDKVFGYILYLKDAVGADIRIPKAYFNPGADGVWFTRDDSLAYLVGLNKEIDFVCTEHSGGLAVLCTHSSEITDSKGNITRAVGYRNAGTDGVKYTVDDEVLGYIEIIYDVQGNPVKKKRYNGSGGDGIWFTVDDVLFSADEINLAY